MAKTVLITGTSSGLGLAMTEYFLEKEWEVIALTRQPKAMPQHRRLTALACEHTPQSLKEITPSLEAFNNGIDVLINNAGYALVGALEHLTEEKITHQWEVNFLGHVYLTRMMIPLLKKKHGKILNISSLFGNLGCPFHSLYCASKFAIEGFSEALHYELKPHRIACSVIIPGRHHTNFGKNMDITSPTTINDPIYTRQYDGFHRLKTKLTNKTANDKVIFAHRIYQLANKKQLPLRVFMNHDSYFPFIFKKILPTKIINKMQDKLFSSYFY